ncbi:hypothetical protein [Tersicoccus solisilvae]|nr:hypothetical protein [Tersicoccus solisilvae]
MPGGIVGAWVNAIVCGCLTLGAAWAALVPPYPASRGDVVAAIGVALIAAALDTVFIRQVIRETRARRNR